MRKISVFVDLTGQRFGRLTVVTRANSDRFGRAKWHCQCDCGRQCVVVGSSLISSNTKSCGCLNSDVAQKLHSTHAKSGTRLYRVWKSMKQRCYDPFNKRYAVYGGRGITLCDEWLNNFQAFFDWAMANGYDENAPKGQCTIDRIDNDKGYSPDNCRWVDMKVQNNNRSNSQHKA